MQRIVFTFVGNDKPGLVQRLSEHVSAHGGNWLESRLARMAGKFAGIVCVNLPASEADTLRSAFQQLADDGLSITLEYSDAGPAIDKQHGLIAVLGNDRPGIIHEVASALATRHINIEELSSKVESAPMAGIPLFSAQIYVALPAALDLTELHQQLDDIANQLDLDINLELNVHREKYA